MKFVKLLCLLFVVCVKFSIAQDIELINSGEVIKQGIKLYDSSEYKKAIVVFNKVSRSDTNYVWAVYQKALACEGDSQYNQAIKYCQEGLALKEQPEYAPDLYNTYGNTLSDMGKYEQALSVFDAAIAKFPSYSLLYFNKGIVYMASKHPAEAEQLFKQALLINPYMYSAHYQLGAVALQQGKIIPAFISLIGYLVINPQGRYWSKTLTLLNQISKSTDEVLAFKNKRTISPDADYETIEDIVLSKIALDKQYKPVISLDDGISRQIQVLFEKLTYNPSNNDFWMQYYVPYFTAMFKDGKFEPFIYNMFSNVNATIIQDYNKKNKKVIEALNTDAGNYFNLIRSSRQLMYTSRDSVTKKYAFDNGRLVGKGLLVNNEKTLNGKWDFYYPAGNLKLTGSYNAAGKREGDWSYYFSSGMLKSTEHYVNGAFEGKQTYYFSNGNVSSIENYVNGEADGLITGFYYSGSKRSLVHYKAGKKDGEERKYYSNGNLKSLNNYVNGVLSGVTQEYYKSGGIKEAGQYLNGKVEGPYKTYHEDGSLSAEMVFVKDNVVGEWKAYYESGKIREKRNYINNQEDGLHQEYYENGQISATYPAQKGKINGEAVYYSEDGKVYSKSVYENGVIRSVKYFDAAGAQLSSSEMKNKLMDVVSYNAEGIKKAHYMFDQKGDLTGADTVFYSSGKIYQINQYKSGELNGNSVTYYLNGKKKSEINMVAGKGSGYYKSYFLNGKTESEGWMQDGDYQGEWIYRDIKGNITSRSYYLDSELDGYKEEYDPSGLKLTEQKYHNGWLDKLTQYDAKGDVMAVDSFPKGTGKYTLFYPGKKVMAQVNYLNGDFDGPYKTYYFDGSLETSFNYKNGILDSTYTAYFYGGAKRVEGQYKHGGRAGLWKTYNEDGTLYYTSVYANDNLNGERIYYFANGNKDFVGSYKDDLLDGLTLKYDPDGSLAYQVIFANDKAKSYTYQGKDGKLLPFININAANGVFKSYFANGKLSRECAYRDGEKNGQMTIYYTNGQIRSVDVSEYGVSQSVTKDYYADGKLKSEYPYVDDNLEGTGKEYYKSGNLQREIAFVNGVNHGATKYYDENGKLTKTMVYQYGKLISVTK